VPVTLAIGTHPGVIVRPPRPLNAAALRTIGFVSRTSSSGREPYRLVVAVIQARVRHCDASATGTRRSRLTRNCSLVVLATWRCSHANVVRIPLITVVGCTDVLPRV